MRYTKQQFYLLSQKYGHYGSWAVWRDGNVNDTTIINENIDTLFDCNTVVIGLNKSGSTGDGYWQNFHNSANGNHNTKENEIKLASLFNYSKFRGAYFTDLIKKDVDENGIICEMELAKSETVYDKIKKNRSLIQQGKLLLDKSIIDINRDFFVEEMNAIGVDKNTKIILLSREDIGYLCRINVDYLHNQTSKPNFSKLCKYYFQGIFQQQLQDKNILVTYNHGFNRLTKFGDFTNSVYWLEKSLESLDLDSQDARQYYHKMKKS